MRKALIILSMILMALTGCTHKAPEVDSHRVMVTIEPIRFFAEFIGGDYFEFQSQIPKGASPETYDITPQQLVTTSQAAAFLKVGYLGFETAWMERLMEINPSMRVFDLSQGLDLIRTSSNGVEPHIWNSTVNARIIARNILGALTEIDPEHQESFQKGYESLLEKIEETERQLRPLMENVKSRTFLIYHPTLTYFARDWDLSQICIEEDGKEPTIQQLRDITDKSIRDGVKTIFIQPEFDHENAQLIARETGSELSTIYPLAYDWCKEMIHIAEILSRN